MAELVLFADALVRATPLVVTALAVALAFRGGVFNIGAEGQLLLGATGATAVALWTAPALGHFSIVLSLLAAAAAGGLWAGIAAELRRRFHVLEIISTIMLNFVALHLVSYLVRGPLQEPTRIYPQTKSIVEIARLPVILPGTRLHLGFILGMVAALVLQWLFRRTAAGFRIRIVGVAPRAAWSAGKVNVPRTSFTVFVLSGALAGIAGGVEVTGVTFALYENLSPGYGYTAIAVALIAGLRPLPIIASGVFIGILETGALSVQRELAIPASVASVAEAMLILAVLAGTRWRGREIFRAQRMEGGR
ncbi:MAG TPA: ABC transporter permease [Gemmatimonadaceae bacterium]|nr:ABC transporter permease [Gemmatimonadaceae bacterium]